MIFLKFMWFVFKTETKLCIHFGNINFWNKLLVYCVSFSISGKKMFDRYIFKWTNVGWHAYEVGGWVFGFWGFFSIFKSTQHYNFKNKLACQIFTKYLEQQIFFLKTWYWFLEMHER